MKKGVSLCLIFACAATFSFTASAETIYLKSGGKIAGKIVGKSAKSIMIQSDSGQYNTYPSEDIKEIVEVDIPAAQYQISDKPVENHNEPIVKPEEGPSKIALPEEAGVVEWKSDLTDISIPDINAQGMIHGQKFQYEKATLEKSILKIRQGKDFFADLELDIFLFPKEGETIENSTFKVARGDGFGSPHAHIKWKPKDADMPETEMFMKDYAMCLTFGAKTDGKLPGKIYICLPDENKSVVAGKFEADLSEPREAGFKIVNLPIQKSTLVPMGKAAGIVGLIFGSFLGIGIILVSLSYIYLSICLYYIAKKTGREPALLAWIPIANLFLLCKISGVAYLWLSVFFVWLVPIIGPIIGSIGSLVLFSCIWYKIAVVLKKPGWLGILVMVPLINLIIMGYLAFSKDQKK